MLKPLQLFLAVISGFNLAAFVFVMAHPQPNILVAVISLILGVTLASVALLEGKK